MQNARLSGHSGGEGSSQRALPGPSVNGRQLTVRGTLRRALNTREPAARDNAEPKSDEVTLLDVLGLEKDRDAVDSAFKPPSGAPALLRASSGRRHTFFEGATGEVDLDGAGWVDSRSKPAKHTTSGKSSSTPVGVGNYASHADEMRKDAWTAKVLMGTKEEELLGESAEHDTDGRWGMDSASPFTSRRSLQDTAEDGKKPEKASSTGAFCLAMQFIFNKSIFLSSTVLLQHPQVNIYI